jgi:gamma-glutamyl-gamma-aminobutyrate hydrolase PuuD
MSSLKPLIGVTPDVHQTSGRIWSRATLCGVAYTQAIEAAGGIPLVLPLTNHRATLDRLLDRCDGLMLIGGADVSHKFYAPRMPARQQALIQGADEVHDEMEIHLVRAALKRGMPVFGICRGVQIMNVALGGSLIPDLPGHRNPIPDGLCQTLHWQAPSAMQALLGQAPVKVNTSHHQALDRVANGLRVVARAEDGTIEAVEHASARFFWGVQFHPERLVKVAPRIRRLFKAFVAAAASDISRPTRKT